MVLHFYYAPGLNSNPAAGRNCPARGRLAPELACGQIKETIDDLVGFSAGDMLITTAPLTDSERSDVIGDMEIARGKLIEGFNVKYSEWEDCSVRG